MVHFIAEKKNSSRGQDAEDQGNRLPQSECARDGGAAQDNGSEEAQFQAIRLVVLLPVSAQRVCVRAVSMPASYREACPYTTYKGYQPRTRR